MKQRFRVEDNGVICASWEDDGDWTEIYSEREWKEMMYWACKIPVPKDNRGLSCHLVVAVLKKKDIVSRLEMQ